MKPRLIALLLALTLPAPAFAQEDESSDGLATDIRAVAAVVPAKTDASALAVYRRLIPAPLTLPEKPEVGVWLAELSAGRSNQFRPQDEASHWIEGAISIKVRYKDQEGWYPIHYPVTAEFWFHAGRYVGLPKRHADATMAASGNGWKTESVATGVEGPPAISLEWQPDAAADAALVARAYRLPTAPMFPLNAPFVGPDLMRVQYSLRPPYPPQTAVPGGAPPYSATARADTGLVRFSLREDIDDINEDLPDLFGGAKLSDIVATNQTVAGSHAFYAVTLGSTSEPIDTGGYAQKPAAGGDVRGERAARRCRTRDSMTVRYRAVRGAKVRRVRAWAGRKRLAARRASRQRVRISLRRLKPGRAYTVRIVAYQERGIRTTTKRRVRRCA